MIHFENFTLSHGTRILLKEYNGFFLNNKIVGILGPNGSGKTSLLRSLAGLSTSYTGNLFIKGQNLKKYSLKELAQLRTYVPASPLCHWALTAKQVLSIENPLFKETHPLLLKLHLVPLLSQLFQTLSSGEKARLFLAYALMKQTEILILDEITSHLDEPSQEMVLNLLKEEAGQGKTIILSLHQKSLAFAYCDRVLCLENKGLSVLKTQDNRLKVVK